MISTALRETTSKALLALLWLHVPIALAIGMMRGSGLAAADRCSWWRWRWPRRCRGAASGNGLSTRLIFAVALMGGVSVFTYQLAGHPWQIDMHMYFFAALACLVAYCDYRPIVAGTVAVALHHLVLNFMLPAAIYPGGADFGRVVLHAVILLIEAGVLIWLAHHAVAPVRDHGAEDRGGRSRQRRRSPRQRRAQRGRTPAPSRTATRRGANSPPASSARSAASSRRSRWPPAKCRACRRR